MDKGITQDDKINIVVIDSGVNQKHKAFSDDDIKTIRFGDSVSNSVYGHGTAIYGILKKSLPSKKINIINVEMSGIEDGITVNEIINVLEYLLDNNIDADIINMSLGISCTDELDKLYDLCSKITDRGTIIVSAFDNAGSISYPAAFDNVIGVVSGDECRTVSDFEYYDDYMINIAAKGGLQRVAWCEPDYIIVSGNSFACAHVTAQVAKFLMEGIRGRQEVLNEFRKRALRQHKIYCSEKESKELFSIKRAALFPFNKEMHSLIRYYKLLNFDIVAIYDTKYSATVGATTSQILQDDDVKIIKIENLDNINWENFDTLILGHLDVLSQTIPGHDLKSHIIKEATRNNKNIYSFDDIYKSEYVDNFDLVYCPYISKSDIPANRLGKLFRTSKPVVGIFGTSSQQGKFTLQLKLRELFLQNGYNIGQIGTEPSALLYGMDYVYPMGYNSSVYISGYESIMYLNSAMNELCRKNKDIIIVGAQSGSVTYDTGNVNQYNLPQYDFLLGTLPDAIILCVNPYDDMEYIERTIHFLEAAIECKVISIVVFPMDMNGVNGAKRRLSEEKYIKIKSQMEDFFHIPIYMLGNNNDMKDLFGKIISFFE